MWYKNSYRRHLCDMHIDDWDESFLSEFNAESYYTMLKKANVKSAMIYFHSHIGYCYYPTKVGYMHKSFIGREDEVKKLVDLCHKGGIDVIGYYSLIYNNWAFENHPEWRLTFGDNQTWRDIGQRYGLCCPNNMEYREHVFTQMREMSEYFQVDGMFFDMPFWPHPCNCKNCRERWAREVGTEFPTKDDSQWELFTEKRKEWLAEFSLAVTKYQKELTPDVSVEQNYAFTAQPQGEQLISEKVNDACDYVGGDVSRDFLTQSFTCKYFYSATHNQPFEYMPTRCQPNLENHTTTKSHDRMKLGIMLTCAHHGATLFIDAIDPVGTLDERVYELLGKLYEEEKEYEPYLTGEMVQDVGVFYHLASKLNMQGQKHNNYNGTINTVKAMIEQHKPVGVIASENYNDLSKYKFIILSNPNHLTDKIRKDLVSYVENGGTLYFSNTDETELFNTLIGGKCVGYTEERKTYVGAKPKYEEIFCGFSLKYPLPFECSLPIVTDVDEQYVAAKIVLPYTNPIEYKFASIHSNPPGIITDIPALVIKPYGKGTVIWSAAPIECGEVVDFKNVMGSLINEYATGSMTVESNVSPLVELVSFEDKYQNVARISAVCLVESDYTIVQPKFDITYRTNKKVKSVVLLPCGEKVPFKFEDNKVTFTARELNIFDMYEIIFEEE